MTPEQALCAQAEAALGENLVWLSDQLDQHIRQKDADALRRLKQLNDGWIALCKLQALLKTNN